MSLDTVAPAGSSIVPPAIEHKEDSTAAGAIGAATSSSSLRVDTAAKGSFEMIRYCAWLCSAMLPGLSTLVFLPLAGYHGLCVRLKEGGERQRQITNALACCILAFPFLGQFYFSKAFGYHHMGITTDNEVVVLESNDPLFCYVTKYWFEDKFRASVKETFQAIDSDPELQKPLEGKHILRVHTVTKTVAGELTQITIREYRSHVSS